MSMIETVPSVWLATSRKEPSAVSAQPRGSVPTGSVAHYRVLIQVNNRNGTADGVGDIGRPVTVGWIATQRGFFADRDFGESWC